MKINTKQIALALGLGTFLALLGKKIMSKYPLIWNTITKGESKTFNDYNYYKIVDGRNKLYGKLNAVNTEPFSSKPLTKLSIKEVMEFQSRSRINGQLFATGRFQIIPTTLKGLVSRLKVDVNRLYDESIQMKFADALIDERKNVRDYLNGNVADTDDNLKKATLDVAMIWSSVGVPFDTMGSRQFVSKDQSYYYGGGDKASVPSSSVMDVLRRQRRELGYA